MPRTFLPSGRKFLFLLAITATATGAWWWTRPPREPVSPGGRLSDWVVHYSSRRIFISCWGPAEADPQERKRQLQDYGSPGVAWLIYQLEHGKREAASSQGPFRHAPGTLRRRLPEEWGGLRPSTDRIHRATAAYTLAVLGPKATPAIPALARCLREDDAALVDAAAEALHAIGPASWPAVHEAWEHGDSTVRIALLSGIQARLKHRTAGPELDTDLERVTAALIKACHDPDATVRIRALDAVDSCFRVVYPHADLLNPALLETVRLLADEDWRVQQAAASVACRFDLDPSLLRVHLAGLLNAPRREVRAAAAKSLATLNEEKVRSASKAAPARQYF